MSMYRGVYVVRAQIATVTAAKTLIQIKAGATTNLDLLRASFSIEGTAVDEAVAQIVRKTAAATVTSATPLLYNQDGPAADAVGGTAATGTNASAEGTDGNILVEESFNNLSPFLWVPTVEERIRVQAAGFIALKHALAITSATVRAYLVFGEL